MFTVVEWTENLDLTEFYKLASIKDFANNSNQKIMIDCDQI
jgi:hypothetical protein